MYLDSVLMTASGKKLQSRVALFCTYEDLFKCPSALKINQLMDSQPVILCDPVR